MKSKIIIAIVLLAGSVAMAQKSCCEKSTATESFAMLTQDENFVNTHLAPIPFTLSKSSTAL